MGLEIHSLRMFPSQVSEFKNKTVENIVNYSQCFPITPKAFQIAMVNNRGRVESPVITEQRKSNFYDHSLRAALLET